MTAVTRPHAHAAPEQHSTWVLHVAESLDEVNRHWAALTAAGMIGAAEIDGRADVYFPRRVPDLALSGWWTQIEDRDWHEQWRAGLRPVAAGPWTITPSWLATGGDDEVVIDPGQAFGTGHHETTAQCLEALDALELEGRTLLDVGTGSGVLAIAAARRGATVLAVDTDPLAVDATQANALRNGAEIEIALGSVEHAADRRFDVVVANLDTDMLVRLAARVAAALAPGGVLVASGVSNERVDEATRALHSAELRVTSASGREWSLLRACLAETA